MHRSLDQLLLALHGETPLTLVVRTNQVRPSAWHAETMARVPAVLAALERAVGLAQPYLAISSPLPRVRGSEFGDVLRAHASESLIAEGVEVTLATLWLSTSGAARRVLSDHLLEQVPAWFGRDFRVDVVLRERLAALQGVAATAVPMPQPFDEAAHRLMMEHHRALESRSGTASATAWASPQALRATLGAKAWRRLDEDFDATSPRHVATLLELTHEEREALAQHGHLATRMANAAVHRLSAGDFEAALTLYDAAVEGPLDAMAAANPLYAVQDDNNHLGVQTARARRYLERCLPHAAQNPAIFLNAAFVFIELGEPERAMEMLAKAKAGGFSVKPYRNEGLLAGLRDDKGFKALMR